jgi:hypothetical protein
MMHDDNDGMALEDGAARAMEGLYLVRYRPAWPLSTATVAGLYIGRNEIVGMDDRGIRYGGTYDHDAAGRFQGSVILHPPPRSRPSTETCERRTALMMWLDLPAQFADGTARAIVLQGTTVLATFEKLVG